MLLKKTEGPKSGAALLADMVRENERSSQLMAEATAEASFHGRIRELVGEAIREFGKPVVAKNAKLFGEALTAKFHANGMDKSKRAAVEVAKLQITFTLTDIKES